MAIQIAPKPEPMTATRVKELQAKAVEETRAAEDRILGRPSQNKQLISLRLSRDVIEKFRAAGPGWQARINETLRANAP